MRGVKIILLPTLAVLSLALVIWLPQRAGAAVCYRFSCNNLDPVATGCSADAVVVTSKPLFDAVSGTGRQIGTVYLMWSPNCEAGYGHTATMGGDASSIVARVLSMKGGMYVRMAGGTSSLNSPLLGAGSYCDLAAAGVITLGAAAGSPSGGGNTGKSCP